MAAIWMSSVVVLLATVTAALASDVSRPAMLLRGASVCDRPEAPSSSCHATTFEVPVQIMDIQTGWYRTRALRPSNAAAEGWVERSALRIGQMGDCVVFEQVGVPERDCAGFR